ncbi:MAG: polysaccharide biosynthesis tyrosine autokinase [Caulobacteraceae bacterium]|nr:polysaccharide biosynthesis tyrosine autokinase [Caulobacteraceae bacterium]
MSQDAIINDPRGAPEADALAVISAYRRQLPVFLAVMVVVAAIVIGLLITQPKAYTATSSVLMVSSDKITVGAANQQAQQTDAAQSNSVDTQVEVLKSPGLAAAVVDKLNLMNDPEFNSALGKNASLSTPAEQHEAAAMRVLSRLKARRTGETYLATVSFTSRSPSKAALIANTYVQLFIERQRAVKMASVASANALLNSRMDSLRQDAENAARAVQSYKAAHNLTSAGGSTISEREIADTSVQLALTRAQEAEAQARLNAAQSQVRNGSNGEDTGEALNSMVIRDLRAQRALITQKLAEMHQRLGPRHPDVIQAEHQLADTDSQIQAEVNRIMSNLKAQADVSRQRTASLAGSLASARNAVVASNEASVSLDELQRNADASRTIYEAFLAKYKETAQQQAVTQPDAQVASVAETPLAPSSPNKPLDVLLGLLLGAGAGVLAAIVRRTLESGLRTQDEVEAKLGLPYLSGVPIASSAIKKLETKSPIEAILKHPLSGYAEAFRTIVTAISAGSPEERPRVIAFTSSLPNEGKTTTTLCMAQILAMGGSSVIVLDCDLRRRNVNSTMNLNATKGLLDVIAGRMTVREAVLVDEKTGVNYLVLPQNAVATTKSPLETPAFDALLAHLKTLYDYVIIDTPPLLPIVDSRVLAQKVEALVLLVRWQKTPRKAAEQSIKLLSAVGVTPVGVVLTQVDLKAQQRYGYGDSSYYYKGYRDYYLEGEH